MHRSIMDWKQKGYNTLIRAEPFDNIIYALCITIILGNSELLLWKWTFFPITILLNNFIKSLLDNKNDLQQ